MKTERRREWDVGRHGEWGKEKQNANEEGEGGNKGRREKKERDGASGKE